MRPTRKRAERVEEGWPPGRQHHQPTTKATVLREIGEWYSVNMGHVGISGSDVGASAHRCDWNGVHGHRWTLTLLHGSQYHTGMML